MPALPGPEPERWNDLAAAAGNLFATHTWAQCWWDHYGHGTPHVLHDDPTAPSVVLPVHRRGRLLRQLRLIGNGPADLLTPAAAPPDWPRALGLLREALDGGRLRGDVLLLQDLPVADPWWQGLPVSTISSEPSPLVRFEPGLDWDGYLATCSRNLRSQARRKPTSLAAAHDVEVRVADATSLATDLATLCDLHARRWQDETTFLEPTQLAFTRAFAAAALERGWLRLLTLDLDGRPVASLLLFRFGGHEYLYQAGRDPAADRLSAGFVLLVHALREAASDGVTEFRFLRGDESYKDRWANAAGDITTVALPLTRRGRAAVRLAARRAARRRVAGGEKPPGTGP